MKKLSQDRIIQIVLLIIVVILAGFLLAKKDSKPTEEDITFTLTDEDIEFVDENTEEPADEEVTTSPAAPAPTTPVKTTTPASTPAPAPAASCTPGISAKKSSDLRAVLLSWARCESDDFQFYKIVKSSTNPNPSYPSSSVVLSSPNRSVLNYVDKAVASGTTYYYRACVVERLGQVSCGNKVSVNY